MTIDELKQMAEAEGLTVDEFDTREVAAAAFPEGWIMINPRKFDSETALKCALAHEIGHCLTGTFYRQDSPIEYRRQCEQTADNFAARILCPPEAVRRAKKAGMTTVDSLAAYFQVTAKYAEIASREGE